MARPTRPPRSIRRSAESGPADQRSATATRWLDAATAPADHQIRLISAVILLLGLGVFLALPFVLSSGAVVFLPPVTATMLSFLLTPLAFRLVRLGLPSMVASLLALVILLAVVAVALMVMIQPAWEMVGQVPHLARVAGQRLAQLRVDFAWLSEVNRQLGRISGNQPVHEVVIAEPSVIEQVAIATPAAVLEALLTVLLTLFMVEARIHYRRRLMAERDTQGVRLQVARVIRSVQDRVASYLLTVAQINFAVGVIVATVAWTTGFAAPVMWGGLAFVLNFLPYLGPAAMIGLLALVGLGTAKTVAAGLLPPLAYLALHAIEANLVTPRILGKRLTLNPISILIAISYFTWIWGALGAVLSVPLLLMLTVLIEHLGRPNVIGFLFGEPLFNPKERDLAETVEPESLVSESPAPAPVAAPEPVPDQAG